MHDSAQVSFRAARSANAPYHRHVVWLKIWLYAAPKWLMYCCSRFWTCGVAAILFTTDAEATFKVNLADGELKVEWTPDLNDNGTKTNRIYVIQGKQSMDDEWGEKAPRSRFFRVRVGLPEP